MVAMADETHLFCLDFLDRKLPKIKDVEEGETPPLLMIEKELEEYFAKTLKVFKTPIFLQGTPFQKKAWEALREIPYGEVRSYKLQAEACGHPLACRAIGSANGANVLSIIVPCHRVILTTNKLGGMVAAVLEKKLFLNMNL